jgi:hypothetical protein
MYLCLWFLLWWSWWWWYWCLCFVLTWVVFVGMDIIPLRIVFCWYYTVENRYFMIWIFFSLILESYNLVQGSFAGMLSCAVTYMMLVLVHGFSVEMLSYAVIGWYSMLMDRWWGAQMIYSDTMKKSVIYKKLWEVWDIENFYDIDYIFVHCALIFICCCVSKIPTVQ